MIGVEVKAWGGFATNVAIPSNFFIAEEKCWQTAMHMNRRKYLVFILLLDIVNSIPEWNIVLQVK